MQCLACLRILTLIVLCQPSLHSNRVEDDRESYARDVSYMKSPRKVRSDFANPEFDEPKDDPSIKRSFLSRPIGRTNRRSVYAKKQRRNEPHYHMRRTVPHHRSIEGEEYHNHGKGKTYEHVNADYRESISNIGERDVGHCGRKQRHSQSLEDIGRNNVQDEYYGDGGVELKSTGVRRRRFRDAREEEKMGNGGHKRNIESETFLGGEETIQDGQKELMDSFRRRKRTGKFRDESNRQSKEKKKKKANRRNKVQQGNRKAQTNFKVVNKNKEKLGQKFNFEESEMKRKQKKGNFDQKKYNDGLKVGSSRQASVKDKYRKIREIRQIMNNDGYEGNVKRLRRQVEEQQNDGTQLEEQEETGDSENVHEAGGDAFLENEEYGGEVEATAEENEQAEDMERDSAMASQGKKETEMETRSLPLDYSKLRNLGYGGQFSRGQFRGEMRDQDLWNKKYFEKDKQLTDADLKFSGREGVYSNGRMRNIESKKRHRWGQEKLSRQTGKEGGKVDKESERRRWVYINNVYQYPTTRQQQKNSRPNKMKTSVGDVRTARRVHRKLPDVKEFDADEDAKKDEANWEKEYAMEEAEEADRDHRQAETMETEDEVQEQEQEQEKDDTETEQDPGIDAEEEMRSEIPEREKEHKRLEKNSRVTKLMSPRHERKNLERREFRMGGNLQGPNIIHTPRQSPPPQQQSLPSGCFRFDNEKWDIFVLLTFSLLMCVLS